MRSWCQDVPAGVAVVGIPAKAIVPAGRRPGEFLAYGTPRGDLPDPVARALEAVAEHVGALHARIDTLEKQAIERQAGASRSVPHVVVDNDRNDTREESAEADRLTARGGKDC